MKLALPICTFLNNILVIRLVASAAGTEYLASFWIGVWVSDLLLIAVGTVRVLADLFVKSKS